MAGEFPSDGQVYGAVDEFVDALERVTREIYLPPSANAVDAIEGFWKAPDADAARHDLTEACRPVLEIQPDGFHDLADGLYRSLRPLDEGEQDSQGFFEGYHAAPEQLSGWHGQAADAVRLQVERIGKFATEQSRAMTRTAGCMIAAFQVSALARGDLIAVFQTGASACRAMAATHDTQALQAQLYVGAGLAAGTLNYLITPALIARALTSAAQAIGTTTTLVNAAITGGDPAALLDSVRQGQQGVVDRMHASYSEIVRRTDDISGRGPAVPIAPLPPSADVHGPGFRYDDFSSPWRSGAGYDAAVRSAAATPDPPAPLAPGETNTIRGALG